jgi:hypothetical protein
MLAELLCSVAADAVEHARRKLLSKSDQIRLAEFEMMREDRDMYQRRVSASEVIDAWCTRYQMSVPEIGFYGHTWRMTILSRTEGGATKHETRVEGFTPQHTREEAAKWIRKHARQHRIVL